MKKEKAASGSDAGPLRCTDDRALTLGGETRLHTTTSPSLLRYFYTRPPQSWHVREGPSTNGFQTQPNQTCND